MKKVYSLIVILILFISRITAQPYMDGGREGMFLNKRDSSKEIVGYVIFLAFLVITWFVKNLFKDRGKNSASAWGYAILTVVILIVLWVIYWT